MDGWVKIHRQVGDSRYWLTEPFTRGQAWIDLIILANHKPGFFRVRGVRVEVGRGQVGYSEQSLAKRWKWSRGKVRRFLQELEENDSQIVQQKTNITTLISIVNYEKYQTNGTASDTASSTADGQQTVQQTDINKNDKKNKNDKNVTRRYLSDGFHAFNRAEVASLTHTLFLNFQKQGLSEQDAQRSANEAIAKDQEAYGRFLEFIDKNAPSVNKLQYPFSIKEFIEIRERVKDGQKVKELLLKMDNWKPLLSKNKSAYKTFLNWQKIEDERRK